MLNRSHNSAILFKQSFPQLLKRGGNLWHTVWYDCLGGEIVSLEKCLFKKNPKKWQYGITMFIIMVENNVLRENGRENAKTSGREWLINLCLCRGLQSWDLINIWMWLVFLSDFNLSRTKLQGAESERQEQTPGRMQTGQRTMPVGNRHRINPPLSEIWSIVSFSRL